MGTRHQQKVIDENGILKVSQYGQWDGYPSGQGIEILKFLSVKSDVEKLKSKLKEVRFLDKDGVDKEFFDSYNENAPEWSRDPDNRTEHQIKWFESLISRNIGSDIYKNIIDYDSEVILIESDGSWCEGFYTIDFQKNVFISEFYDERFEFSLDNLPTNKAYLEIMEPEDA